MDRGAYLTHPVPYLQKSHPTVGVALSGSNVSERLGSSREELPGSNDIFTSKMVLVLLIAHRRAGRVARTNFFELMFRVRN